MRRFVIATILTSLGLVLWAMLFYHNAWQPSIVAFGSAAPQIAQIQTLRRAYLIGGGLLQAAWLVSVSLLWRVRLSFKKKKRQQGNQTERVSLGQ